MKIRDLLALKTFALILLASQVNSINTAAIIEPFLIRQTKIPFVINFPGTYVVIDELDYNPTPTAGGAAITVMADNVHLNFNNRTLVVHNDTTFARTGILITGADNVIVTDPVVTMTNDIGAVGATTIGIDIQNSVNTTVRRADISGVNDLTPPSFGSTGININNSQNCEFIDALMQSCLNGIVINGNSSNMSFQDIAIESAGSGISITNSARISFNDSILHSVFGIAYLIDGSTDIVLNRCESLSCADDGISLQNSSQRCIVRDCTVGFANNNSAGNAGIYIDGSSTNNLVLGCAVISGTLLGISNDGGTSNRIYNCVAENNTTNNFGSGVVLQAIGNAAIQSATTNFWINVALSS